jgi:hypothetical protein
MMMKNILGVHGKTSNLALHAELGLFPLVLKPLSLCLDIILDWYMNLYTLCTCLLCSVNFFEFQIIVIYLLINKQIEHLFGV